MLFFFRFKTKCQSLLYRKLLWDCSGVGKSITGGEGTAKAALGREFQATREKKQVKHKKQGAWVASRI